MAIGEALEASPAGKAAAGLSTGEPGSDSPRTDLTGLSVQPLDAPTIAVCSNACKGARANTARHCHRRCGHYEGNRLHGPPMAGHGAGRTEKDRAPALPTPIINRPLPSTGAAFPAMEAPYYGRISRSRVCPISAAMQMDRLWISRGTPASSRFTQA